MSNAWERLALGGLPVLVWLAAAGLAAGPAPQDSPSTLFSFTNSSDTWAMTAS